MTKKKNKDSLLSKDVQKNHQVESSRKKTSSVRNICLSEAICNVFSYEECDNMDKNGLSINKQNIFGFDCIEENISSDKDEVCIEWDDLIINTVQKMSLMNAPKIDSVFLVPLCLYSNHVF